MIAEVYVTGSFGGSIEQRKLITFENVIQFDVMQCCWSITSRCLISVCLVKE